MSLKPMEAPEENSKYAELFIILKDQEINENSWALRLLYDLTKFPFINSTWFSTGHTVQTSKKIKDTKFSGALIYPSLTLGHKLFREKIKGKQVNFYSVLPLYKEEIDFARKNGVDLLLDKFDENKINDIVDIKRINIAKG